VILPTKHISENRSLLGIGGVLLARLENPRTISKLWDEVRDHPDIRTFERFVLALDLLYIIGAVEQARGQLRRTL